MSHLLSVFLIVRVAGFLNSTEMLFRVVISRQLILSFMCHSWLMESFPTAVALFRCDLPISSICQRCFHCEKTLSHAFYVQKFGVVPRFSFQIVVHRRQF